MLYQLSYSRDVGCVAVRIVSASLHWCPYKLVCASIRVRAQPHNLRKFCAHTEWIGCHDCVSVHRTASLCASKHRQRAMLC